MENKKETSNTRGKDFRKRTKGIKRMKEQLRGTSSF
jgi:hypothetical protein